MLDLNGIAMFGNAISDFCSEKISAKDAIIRGSLLMFTGFTLCIIFPRYLLSIFIMMIIIVAIIVVVCTKIHNKDLTTTLNSINKESKINPIIAQRIQAQREQNQKTQ